MTKDKYLIVYYSFTENLASVIPLFNSNLDIDTIRLELEEDYPKIGKDFLKRYRNEIAKDILPKYKNISLDINKYNIIFIGVPNWGNKIPPVVKTFLSNYDFTGKTIIPVVTHGGNGKIGIIEDITSMTVGSTIKKALVFKQNNLSNEILGTFLRDVL